MLATSTPRLVLLQPPGRFPTVNRDPGLWWDALARGVRYKMRVYSANYEWWRTICSENVVRAILEPKTWSQALRARVEWRSRGLQLMGAARNAAAALAALERPATFSDPASYCKAGSMLQHHIAQVSESQRDLFINLDQGPVVPGLNYADSEALAAYARRDTLLHRLIRRSLAAVPLPIRFLAVTVSSPFDLLTAMISVLELKRRDASLHACLVDHGYENFSLHAHMPALRERGTLDAIFDSIIESKDDRDRLVPRLAMLAASGAERRGFVRAADFDCASDERPQGVEHAAALAFPLPPPPVPAFVPEPVFWTRVSARRCYWSKCTFCTQNSKYVHAQAATKSEIADSLNRVEAAARLGYRNFIFSDEALSPAVLRTFSRLILQRGLALRWACRSKMEVAHDAALFRLMKAAGCYEVLFGIESISPRVQRLMAKHDPKLDRRRTREVLAAAAAAGISTHVNLIAGFPGDTLAEVEDSVDFVIGAFAGQPGATFVLNRFALFPDTPVLARPAAFGIESVSCAGDMPAAYGYTLIESLRAAHDEVLENIPRLQRKLYHALGWEALAAAPDTQGAIDLYFNSGHGAIMKANGAGALLNAGRMVYSGAAAGS